MSILKTERKMADNNPFPGENNTGHIWDDNIRELDNPVPRWWMWAFWASVAWLIGYTILYPSWPVGNEPTKGVLGWTSMNEFKEGMAEVEAMRAKYEDQIKGMAAKEILADPGLTSYTVASAKVLFGDNCAACHGSGGQGGPDFPVLADDDWLYGGAVEIIEQTITLGRRGIMPAQAKVATAEEINTLANYVVGLSQGKDDPAGKALFLQKACMACHGMDAKGIKAMGSANLTDAVWRFTPSGFESARQTITHGVNDPGDSQARQAIMPSFKDRLSANDIKKLAVYVYQLGGGQ
jgi:cytochrome c oxidase cbb3-type subunit 3